MQISLDYEQVALLRDILTSAVMQLRTESARADSSKFRELLHERERIAEAILSKLAGEPRVQASASPGSSPPR